METKCLNCGKELHHVEGRRKKKYCDANCKGEYWRKTNKSKEMKFVQKKTYDKIFEELKELKSKVSYQNAPIEAYDAPNPTKPIQDEPKQEQKPQIEENKPKWVRRFHADYSKMPKGLTLAGREAWKEKTYDEQYLLWEKQNK